MNVIKRRDNNKYDKPWWVNPSTINTIQSMWNYFFALSHVDEDKESFIKKMEQDSSKIEKKAIRDYHGLFVLMKKLECGMELQPYEYNDLILLKMKMIIPIRFAEDFPHYEEISLVTLQFLSFQRYNNKVALRRLLSKMNLKTYQKKWSSSVEIARFVIESQRLTDLSFFSILREGKSAMMHAYNPDALSLRRLCDPPMYDVYSIQPIPKRCLEEPELSIIDDFFYSLQEERFLKYDLDLKEGMEVFSGRTSIMYSVMGTAESVFIEALLARDTASLERTDKYGNNVLHYVALYDRHHLVSPTVVIDAIGNVPEQLVDATSIILAVTNQLKKVSFTVRKSIHLQRFEVELDSSDAAAELEKLKVVPDAKDPKVTFQVDCKVTNHCFLGGNQSCNINAKNNAGDSPLEVAVLRGHLRTVQAFLKWNGLDANQPLAAFTKIFSSQKRDPPVPYDTELQIAQSLLSYYIQKQVQPSSISMKTLAEEAEKNGKSDLLEKLVVQLSDFHFFTHHYDWCVSSSSYTASSTSSSSSTSDSSFRFLLSL